MDLARALAFSHFASQALAAAPDLAGVVDAAAAAPFDWNAPGTRPDTSGDAAELGRSLRRLRRRVFLHTLVRDLTGRASLAEVCATHTMLADVALAAATSFHARELDAVHGAPIGAESGTPQELIVVGMGKLGGGELNVSSDIDLVFVYPEEGETSGPRTIANREYFDRLGRRVITALHDVTADGYVFRVDMRLRPYGESGPLTTSFAGLENYLVTQGRAWERYAWLKARAITGARHDELAALVTPFVFRKYLDFDAYEGLRDIHRQIRDQGARRDYAGNVKLGDGGIREIEFIAQALQIVRGGRDADLRVRGTLPALAALGARGLLPPLSVSALTDAYVFLRSVEHRLQYRDDRQTHQLPQDAAEHALLAEAMDATPDAFDQALARHRGVVSVTFGQTLGDAGRATDRTDAMYATLWDGPDAVASLREALLAAGYADPDALAASLARVRASGRYLQLPAASRDRFDALVPQLLAVAAAHPGLAGAQPVFERLLALLETIARRSAYLALVIEHPPLLPRLANLMGASAWAADYLTRHPLLLDELLDARTLFAEPDWNAWRSELLRQLAQRPDDAEHQMDVLRHFQHAQAFRLLVQDLTGQLTVERLADHLSALADVVLEGTLAACWTHMTGGTEPPPRFAIVGYGKLGGKELGYASDLDLVFLFDVDPDDPAADTREARYTRLGQRLNTWLTSTTAAGQLYDTDLRLRPDGAKGLLVSSLSGFRRYQRGQAWAWEHQALTRARFVAGDREVGAAFEAEREAILRMERDPRALATEVVAMRRRMHAGHPNPSASFDLKHDPGGMVDIEFAVQYLVLAHAHRHALLTRNAGNIALLRFAGELRLVPADLAGTVADAYREYRRLQHQVRLTLATHARVDPAPQAARRAAVAALWAHVFGGAWQDARERELPAAGGKPGEIG
ncbi:MAG: bifunctional [glutamate--ammonia ligase]-adenylyl-L-tyrosine phosphorylase/[glutamate--ammonia-ligase] adenylyltransferase [Burkholderiales bacterium]|nr:bifunctional [glutamate--ammonia ligase]-adenylyl-L-tyrosine phosphorylase/[glutamate--ammonia-ligase] adenylyltransferase [Burkholderiales bacterium]